MLKPCDIRRKPQQAVAVQTMMEASEAAASGPAAPRGP